MGKTHLIAGAVAGYAATQDWKGALIGGMAGLLPDIDEPHSTVGRPLFFLSFPLNQLVGHRTLTHSLLFLAAGYALLATFSPMWALAFVCGVASHILGDALTGKVKVFYPLSLSVGLNVSPLGYRFIDLFARMALIVWAFVETWREVMRFILLS